jgi:hypothetical protein
MSTPDQPSTPPLTRRQLREIRNTGSTPVITPKTADADTPAPTPLPRPSEPAQVAPAPRPDASVDLGVSPLTRRQAREQERIRTASVPVISADVAAAGAFAPPARDDSGHHDLPVSTAEAALTAAAGEDEDAAPVTVSEQLGSQLLAGEVQAVELPPSFDQLLTRDTSSTGAISAPNALILSQTPTSPLVGPVTATGEVIITGTFDLPEGLGSRGHAAGTTDGFEADAVLIDGELPPASSPTPIAASAAVSTVKAADEIIRPPAPEKGSRLMLALTITAGALALALIGVLILAVTTGVFS